jgi:pyridoxamine 5'-phosphate oxidase
LKQKITARPGKKKEQNFLSEEKVAPDPFQQFAAWFSDAAKVVAPDVNAMCLATADHKGRPSARMVLLREVDWRGLVFYTNYDSRKGRELAENPHAAATFHWKELKRQVRFTGKVKKVTRKESEAYFDSRPPGSRISAAISPQSAVIPGRSFLEKKKLELERLLTDPFNVPCPANWGGYRLIPAEIEFWQEGEHRLHDRIVYTKKGKTWTIRRLAP